MIYSDNENLIFTGDVIMNQKEIALGVTAVGLISSVGYYLLKKNKSGDGTSETRSNPRGQSGENRIKKIKQSKKTLGKIKKKITKEKQENEKQQNLVKAIKRAASSDREVPAVIWTTTRSIFLNNHKRKHTETIDDFINRVFDEYANEGIDKSDALSRSFAIATKSVQDKGLIEKGTQVPTHLGIEWGKMYEREVGTREFDRRFTEFQAILRLAKE